MNIVDYELGTSAVLVGGLLHVCVFIKFCVDYINVCVCVLCVALADQFGGSSMCDLDQDQKLAHRVDTLQDRYGTAAPTLYITVQQYYDSINSTSTVLQSVALLHLCYISTVVLNFTQFYTIIILLQYQHSNVVAAVSAVSAVAAVVVVVVVVVVQNDYIVSNILKSVSPLPWRIIHSVESLDVLINEQTSLLSSLLCSVHLYSPVLLSIPPLPLLFLSTSPSSLQ